MASAMSTKLAGKTEQSWPDFKAVKPDPILGKKEMSPEQTLIEFISTSAGLHGIQNQPLRSLEWDLLKVFPYNIMPANAAAWYMAKRKYYADQPTERQLLPYLLNKYPDKFKVSKFQVEFLETYSKETAKRKLNYLVQFGLDAYFSHKVDEYGVYFFDPNYYENTEPFHESLRLCARSQKSRLLAAYFNQSSRFNLKVHSGTLYSIIKDTQTKVLTNTTGVIVSMTNNEFGYLKFGSGEKALFSAKGLFRDGWQYTGDPIRLPAMYFDAFKAPQGVKSGDESCHWFAVLVWCGRKPAPKYYSSLADFKLTPTGFMSRGGPEAPVEGRKLRQPSSSMMIGQVVSIRKNGAIISVRDDSKEKVFIPGWSKESNSRSGVWLTTLTGDTVGVRDLVAYYIDNEESMPGFTAVGKNVMVLKEHEEDVAKKRRRNRMSVSLSEGACYEPKNSESEYDSNHRSEVSSEDESVDDISDGELEWLEKDLEELIEKEGPQAKTRSFLQGLKTSLAEVRAATNKVPSNRERRDSGLGSNPTTPKNTRPLKVGKRAGNHPVFWRTKAALASIDEDYRSSEDEDYETGDELSSSDQPQTRVRKQSFVSTTSTLPKQPNRRISTGEGVERAGPLLPYWVRAISMPEEFDKESQLFIPLDKGYKEEYDPDYWVPETDDDYEEEEEDERNEIKVASTEEKEEVKVEGEEGENQHKENLEDELKLLLEETEKELPEDLIEGKHRYRGPKIPSPEKIVITKPEGEDQEPEIITIEEPVRERKCWYLSNYIKFIENVKNLDVDLDSDVRSNIDPEYVPPAIILDDELDYDEYDPEELVEEEELKGLQEDLKMNLHKAGNYIPIWVHVDSVKEKKERALEQIAIREREQEAKEAALKAAQEKEAARKAEAENAENAARETESVAKENEKGLVDKSGDSPIAKKIVNIEVCIAKKIINIEESKKSTGSCSGEVADAPVGGDSTPGGGDAAPEGGDAAADHGVGK